MIVVLLLIPIIEFFFSLSLLQLCLPTLGIKPLSTQGWAKTRYWPALNTATSLRCCVFHQLNKGEPRTYVDRMKLVPDFQVSGSFAITARTTQLDSDLRVPGSRTTLWSPDVFQIYNNSETLNPKPFQHQKRRSKLKAEVACKEGKLIISAFEGVYRVAFRV